eukprot:1593642-Prymnesium_polylepis.1
MADFLSRYPTFQQYVTPREEPELPSELFRLNTRGRSTVYSPPWGRRRLAREMEARLYEAKNPAVVESVWQHQMVADGNIDSDDVTLAAPGPELMLLSAHVSDTTKVLRESRTAYQLPCKVTELREAVTAQ